MPTPGSDNISSRACSKTGTGITAGPALKLKIRLVIRFLQWAVSGEQWEQKSTAYSSLLSAYFLSQHRAGGAQDNRARHQPLSLDHHEIRPAGNYGTLATFEGAQSSVDHLVGCLHDARGWAFHFRRRKKTRLSNAGTKRHYPDSVRAVFFPERLAKRKHESFGGGISCHERNGLKSGGRSHIDDPAALALAHRLQKAMRQFDQRAHIQIDHIQLALKIEFGKIAHR